MILAVQYLSYALYAACNELAMPGVPCPHRRYCVHWVMARAGAISNTDKAAYEGTSGIENEAAVMIR